MGYLNRDIKNMESCFRFRLSVDNFLIRKYLIKGRFLS